MLCFQFRSLSINSAFPFNTNILKVNGYKQSPTNINTQAFSKWIEIAIIFYVGTSQQTGSFLKMQGHIVFHSNSTRQIYAFRKNYFTTSTCITFINCRLKKYGVHCFSITYRTMIFYIYVFCMQNITTSKSN